MTAKHLNLTLLKVNKELDTLESIHSSYTYRVLVRNPEFRQSLLDYILRRIPNHYLLIDSEKDSSIIAKVIKLTSQERYQIYQLIEQRISRLRQHDSHVNDEKNLPMPEK
jgi:hypothetical protein